MGLDLDLSLDSGGRGSSSTQKLQITATPPPLTTVQSGVATTVTIPITAVTAMNITGITSNNPNITITAPTLPLALTAGATSNIVLSINSTSAGQHYENIIVTDGTLSKSIPIHYVVAGATDTFTTNNGNQIVNNHKTVINT
jgi:hypothetical protein